MEEVNNKLRMIQFQQMQETTNDSWITGNDGQIYRTLGQGSLDFEELSFWKGQPNLEAIEQLHSDLLDSYHFHHSPLVNISKQGTL